MTDKMAASIETYHEMYKRPYLLPIYIKFQGKMFVFLMPFYWSDS